MASKDYYRILQLPPTASADELKKSFRKLALQYHPDVAANDPQAAEKFKDIKEAYTVLSNNKTRQKYHYDRFYTNYKTQPIITANTIAKQAQELAEFAAVLNPFRVDFDLLNRQIELCVNEANILVLQKANDIGLNKKLVQNILQCTSILPFSYVGTIHQLLKQLAETDKELFLLVHKTTQQQQRLHQWEQYKFPLAIAVAILLCLVFYFLI